MFWIIIVFAAAVALTAPAHAGDTWRGFVFAFGTAMEAERVCPGAKRNELAFIAYRTWAVKDETKMRWTPRSRARN